MTLSRNFAFFTRIFTQFIGARFAPRVPAAAACALLARLLPR
jgi:hypothetical protein